MTALAEFGRASFGAVGNELSHNAAEMAPHLPPRQLRVQVEDVWSRHSALGGRQHNGRRSVDGGSGMKSALFRRGRKKARVEETRLEAGEITVHVISGSNQLTVAVAGRSTVDSSPHVRSVLLGLLRRGTTPVVVIDVSALSYLDMSGIATLLEALKAATERSVKLRLAGMSGQARALAEIAQLDTIYRAWGSEVEFR
jgi:anti-sigma B factor antagonist